MEMAGDEIVADGSSGEIVARQENSGKSAGEKKRNETEREKPKEALPKNGNSVGDSAGPLIGDEIHHGEKVRVQESIRKQADAGRQENAENQHAQDGVDEPRPDGQRQPGESHALRAQVDGRDAEIERVAK